ncbi:MAG: hypothetical protein HQL53_13145 [Magnetococcales bacterium]|nr:hypothetical protein [Magnetococcales bacterium]
MITGYDPSLISPEERLQEVAEIVAVAILRRQQRLKLEQDKKALQPIENREYLPGLSTNKERSCH